jgi:DnaK suppressor protein
MKKEQRDILQEKIHVLISRENEKIEELKKLTKPISPENAIGRVSRMDAINNKSVNEAALRASQNKLKKLKYASTQVYEDSFGSCTICGQTMQEGRLLLMPESNKCIRCASR